MTRYEVVRQTSGGKQTASSHRREWVAYLHRRWQDFLQRRRSRRSVEVGVREIGVHYNVLPVEVAEPTKPVPWYAARCKHGTQFLNECDECPGGNPVIPDDVTETDQNEAVQP